MNFLCKNFVIFTSNATFIQDELRRKCSKQFLVDNYMRFLSASEKAYLAYVEQYNSAWRRIENLPTAMRRQSYLVNQRVTAIVRMRLAMELKASYFDADLLMFRFPGENFIVGSRDAGRVKVVTNALFNLTEAPQILNSTLFEAMKRSRSKSVMPLLTTIINDYRPGKVAFYDWDKYFCDIRLLRSYKTDCHADSIAFHLTGSLMFGRYDRDVLMADTVKRFMATYCPLISPLLDHVRLSKLIDKT